MSDLTIVPTTEKKTWFNVVDSDGEQVNEKPLRKKAAEALVDSFLAPVPVSEPVVESDIVVDTPEPEAELLVDTPRASKSIDLERAALKADSRLIHVDEVSITVESIRTKHTKSLNIVGKSEQEIVEAIKFGGF